MLRSAPLLVGALLLLRAGAAVAEEEAAPALGEDGEAEEHPAIRGSRQHFVAAMDLVDRELWEAALAEFDESLRLHGSRTALFNRALCLQRLMRYQEAIASFEEYLGRYGDDAPERRALAERTIGDLRSLLTEVRLEVSPPGATILVRGRELGRAPLEGPLLLHSGQHRLEVRLEGYQPYQADVMVVRDRPQTVRVSLSPEPTTGRLRLSANVPEARLTLDGEELSTLPFEGQLRPGSHELLVTADGYRAFHDTVTIVEDSDHELVVELSRNRLPPAWFLATVSLTAAGLLTTALLGVSALVYDANYDYLDPVDEELYSRGHAVMQATDALLGLTLGAAAATLGVGLLTDWSRLTPRARRRLRARARLAR